MKTKFTLLNIFAIALILIGCNSNTDPDYDQLVLHHAPIHYQDTDDSNYPADYITNFDYDGDWSGTNNWENIEYYDLNAVCYYSVVESATHFFIIYAFYHPRDWTDSFHPTDEHENDFEGILSVIKKDNSEFGTMIAMVTVSHTDFFSFSRNGAGLSYNVEDIDGSIEFEMYENISHPKTFQGPRGHPIKGDASVGDFNGGDNQDGIIYYPSLTESEKPTSGSDRNVKYKLINLADYGNLWTFQLLEAGQVQSKTKTFHNWGQIKGDNKGGCGQSIKGVSILCPENSANAPWGWDDEDDGNIHPGEIAINPAKLINYYFTGLGNFETTYVNNFYLEDLKEQGFNSEFLPNNWNSHLVLEDLYDLLD